MLFYNGTKKVQLCKTVIIMLLRFSNVIIIVSKKVSDATCNTFRHFTKPSHNETKATNVKVRLVDK